MLELEHEADVAADWDAEGEKEVEGGPDCEQDCKQNLHKSLLPRKNLCRKLAHGQQDYEGDSYNVAQAVAETFRALRLDDLEAFKDVKIVFLFVDRLINLTLVTHLRLLWHKFTFFCLFGIDNVFLVAI